MGVILLAYFVPLIVLNFKHITRCPGIQLEDNFSSPFSLWLPRSFRECCSVLHALGRSQELSEL